MGDSFWLLAVCGQREARHRRRGFRDVLLKMGAASKFQLQSTKSQTNPKIEIQNMKHGSTCLALKYDDSFKEGKDNSF